MFCFNFFSLARLTYFGRRPFFSSFVPGVWQGNMEKIKSWAVSLQDVLVQMAKQMQVGRAHKCTFIVPLVEEALERETQWVHFATTTIPVITLALGATEFTRYAGVPISFSSPLLMWCSFRDQQTRPAVNARALEHMSTDVISTLQTLVDVSALGLAVSYRSTGGSSDGG